MNYGHPVEFGLEVGLQDAAPKGAGDVVEAAVLAEALGYDLVTFADDAGDGASDGWTMSAYAAGRTSTVRVAARLDAGARPASVVARGAGSLQLLSSGRGRLLLGPSPAGEHLEVVEEAVAVVRALHDTSRPQATSPGTRHRLAGAEPGPNLERAAPVWLHGSSEVVAALAGRLSDG